MDGRSDRGEGTARSRASPHLPTGEKEGDAAIPVEVREVRRQFDGLIKVFDRAFEVAGLLADDGAVAVRFFERREIYRSSVICDWPSQNPA